MRIPDSLASLYDNGIIDEVLRPLMSGKEAQIFLVNSGAKLCVAKVYKEAQNRSFKHRADYTEGRKVRNTRDQRAMEKRSKHGREQEEAAWRSTEVDVIYRLQAGGVRVPAPHYFIDGVLVMELVVDAEGNPAPRLGDIPFEPEEATRIYHHLIREVVRMLCVGVVHGDLSDFNVLVGADGPVIIDFPQSVDTAHNNGARVLLLRDVDNLHRFLTRFVPNAPRLPYAEEMWDLHQANALTPDTQLTGRYRAAQRRANTDNVLSLIRDANHDERKRRDSLGLRGGPSARESEALRAQPTGPSRQGAPQQSYPRQDGPRQNAPQQSYPRQNAPQQSYPRQNAPQQSYPRQDGPRQNAPQQSYPRQNAPQQSYPRQNAPRQNAPQQSYPQQGGPRQNAPRQNAPQQSYPRQDGPRQDGPRQNAPKPKQEVEVMRMRPQGTPRPSAPPQPDARQTAQPQPDARQAAPRRTTPRQSA